jgi:excinuclease ABC subunit C
VVLGAGVAQIAGLIDTQLGSFAGPGGVASLGYAQLVQTLPISLFGVSVAAVSLPALSVDADGAGGAEALRARLAGGFRRIAFFVVPSAFAFVALGPVIVAMLFQTGRFGSADSALVGAVLAAYGIGLLGPAAAKLFASGFYALQDTRTPVRISVVSLVTSAGAVGIGPPAGARPVVGRRDLNSSSRSRCSTGPAGSWDRTAAPGERGRRGAGRRRRRGRHVARDGDVERRGAGRRRRRGVRCRLLPRRARRRASRRPPPVDAPALIARKLETLPDRPGVYLWKGRDGEILYVGKAKSLRDRVRTYFGADAGDTPEQQALVRQIADLETIIVPDEAQALLLENNLIKEHQPRFNIRLRDDKSYPRIAVTLGEPFPRVLVVRRVTLPGARYFGPYTDVATLRQTLRIIRRLFTVRSCHYALPGEAPERPCLDYHIERCRAPCVGYQSQEDYARMIEDVLVFLEGDTVAVRGRVRERMQEASGRLDFERAGQLRDALRWLEQVERPPAVELVGGGDADAVGYARDGDDACGVILRVRDGRVLAREHRFLEHAEPAGDGAVLSAFLVRYYLPLEARAQRVLLPLVPDDLALLETLAPGVDWRVPRQGTAATLVELADQNARHLLDSLLIEAFDIEERAADPVYAMGRDLGLAAVPRAFVCVDISTNRARYGRVAAVAFEGGRPARRSIVASASAGPGIDDFAAIHEVVTRYPNRRRDRSWGAGPHGDRRRQGPGSGGARGARGAGFAELPVVSWRSGEEVFLPARAEPLRLGRRSPSLKLLQRARDEAHRFAVSYSRKRRSARTITSELLQVPGVGPARRRALLARFGSLAGVRSATVAEIASLPGFSARLAERILERLGGGR